MESALRDCRDINAFPIIIGDMLDRGNECDKTLKAAIHIRDQGVGMWIPGNHEWKHYRYMLGNPVEMGSSHMECQRQLQSLTKIERDMFIRQMDTGIHWINWKNWTFTHASYDPLMDKLEYTKDEWKRVRESAMYGPFLKNEEQQLRKMDWEFGKRAIVAATRHVPCNKNVAVGHTIMSTEKIKKITGPMGGNTFFLDLGCGTEYNAPLACLDIDTKTGLVKNSSHSIVNVSDEYYKKYYEEEYKPPNYLKDYYEQSKG